MTRRTKIVLTLLSVPVLTAAFFVVRHFERYPPAEEIQAVSETAPVRSPGDAADDPCIWVHPSDPELSIIIGTDKKGGLGVYDLQGRQLQYLAYQQNERVQRPNNVDLCQQVTFHGESFALVAVSEKEYDQVMFYRVLPASRSLEEIPGGRFDVGVNPEGVTFYQSARSGRVFVFVSGDDLLDDGQNWIEQWEISEAQDQFLKADLSRRLKVDSETEGLVADNQLGWLYAAEENVGIWKYAAEPDAGEERTLVDSVGFFGHLNHDVEGLAIIEKDQQTGFLIASCQGSDSFVVLRREADNEYVARFRIAAGVGIDAVTHTDGIDVTASPLGPRFPGGVFVAQDDENGELNQNFKLVPWQLIEAQF